MRSRHCLKPKHVYTPEEAWAILDTINFDFDALLVRCGQTGDVNSISQLFETVQFTNDIRNMTLMAAIVNNQITVVKFLINGNEEGKPYVNMRHNNNYPLKTACERNYVEIIKYLIEKGVYCEEAFLWACNNNQFDIARYLIEKRGIRSYKAFLWACEQGYLNIVRYFIKKGIHKDKGLDEAIEWAERGGYFRTIEYLKSRKSWWRKIIYNIKN